MSYARTVRDPGRRPGGFVPGLGNARPDGLAFDPAAYGLADGVTYYLDQYDPGWVPGGPHVSYNPSGNLGGNPGLSPWGYLDVAVPFQVPVRGNVLRGRTAGRAGWYNYRVILGGRSDLDEVVRALQPGAQASGSLPHLSALLAAGLIPSGTSSNPTFDSRDPWAAACDFMAHQDAVTRYRRGELSRAGLLAVYQTCLSAGGTPRSDIWNERNIPGFIGGSSPRINETGDGTVTFPGAPPVDAPSGGTTPLPPNYGGGDDDDECPEGWEPGDGPGVCVRYDCNPGYINVNGVCSPEGDPGTPAAPGGPGGGGGGGTDQPARAGVGLLALGLLGALLVGSR